MAIISVYKIKSDIDEKCWRAAWKIVESSYGVDAICRNIFESEASIGDEVWALETACEKRTKLTGMLLEERDSGATHAFVQPMQGEPIFGISLSNLFE